MQTRDEARQAVRDAMSAAGLTNSDLARAARVDIGTVNDFLSGSRWPRLTTLGKLDEALGWEVGSIDRTARGGSPQPRVSGQPQDDGHVLLDLDLSDVPADYRAEVAAAAQLRALEKAREIRRSLEG